MRNRYRPLGRPRADFRVPRDGLRLMYCRRGWVSVTYLTLTYPTTKSSFKLVVAPGEIMPRINFQAFAMPSAAEKTLPLP